MTPVEEKFLVYEAGGQGGLIVEIPLISPIPQTQFDMAGLLIRAGVDVIQIPIPVRFPWMYGTRILGIQQAAARAGVGYEQSFRVLEGLVETYPDAEFMPVGFYGGLQRMGQSAYVRRCAGLGIRLADVPDYPLVHDGDPRGLYRELRENGIDYITVVSTALAMQPEGSPGYGQLQKLVSLSHGFCFLLAAAGGKTGERSRLDYDGLFRAKERLLQVQARTGRRCPIVAVCGISTPEQVRTLVKEVGVHVMFGSALFTRMLGGQSADEIYAFLTEMKLAAT